MSFQNNNMARNKDKNNIDEEQNGVHNVDDDVVFDDVDEEGFSTENVKKVREKLTKCEEERKNYLDGWQRAKADYINMRKRDEENRTKSVANAKEDVILSIIPVLDSFELAFMGSDAEKTLDENWVAGMKGIQSQLLSILSEHGVSQMNPIGEEFSPSLHDSVESREVDNKKEDGKILEVRQKGYEINGKILRAAKVVVAQIKS
jgi:molecular chaperone GrpE